MKPLKVALICKNENGKRRNNRSMGYFSYAVPEFTWEHIIPGKNFTINWNDYKSQNFDLVFHEDYPYGDIRKLDIPYVFLAIDSTLSEQHYKDRFNQSQKSDLILVDHDNINRFFNTKHSSVYQFPYCVNDKVFYRDDRIRTVDIAYHCSSSAHAGIDERKRIKQLLKDLSVKHNWNLASGIRDLPDYAESFRTAKIVVNQSRTSNNRPHRIFDAMACGAMVLTSQIANIKADKIFENGCFLGFYSDDDLEIALDRLLRLLPVTRERIAEQGYQTVMQNHTWSIRTKQLREIINKEFGL